MIVLDNVSAFQMRTKVFDGVSLHIKEGERVAILGPNGAGKSTLLKLIDRSIYPVEDGGSLTLFGSKNFHLWDLREKIGVVSQELQEDYTPYSTALEVVVSGFFGAIGAHDHFIPERWQIEKARDLLALIGLGSHEKQMFQRLSTGQKRRLLLARALIHDPKALILDEPLSGLDMGAGLVMLEAIRKFCGEGRSLVVATHHLSEIIPEIERVILLCEGEVFKDGRKESVLTGCNLSRIYGVPISVQECKGWYRCCLD
jgi:iron complex transport system ATP-binding protein